MDRRRPLTAAELFDAIGAGYQEAFGRPPVVECGLGELLSRLPPRSRMLDIGSGTGLPVAHDLAAAGHRVTGLDVSP
jgi:predicted TPR repeat methyltransferase